MTRDTCIGPEKKFFIQSPTPTSSANNVPAATGPNTKSLDNIVLSSLKANLLS